MAYPILNIEQGESIDFTDASIGDITGFSWIFPGGLPLGSTGENPTVLYNNIGIFEVSLTTTDAYLVSNSVTKVGIINVSPETWGINFEINSTPAMMGEIINFNNISLGTPTYSEWIIPIGSGETGLTSGSMFDLIGVKYQNWRILTGSHIGSPGINYNSTVSLLQSSYFNEGLVSKPIEITKMGPPENYLEIYNYISPQASTNFGAISSIPYGGFPNEYGGATAHNSSGLSYNFTRRAGGPYLPGVPYPPFDDGGAVLFQIGLEDTFLFNWGLTGNYATPEGLYYPHSDLEAASIKGRAYSAFNPRDGKIRVDEQVSHFAQITMGTGYPVFPCIIDGRYVTPYGDDGMNSVGGNPNYILIRDDYDTNYRWKSQLSLFVLPQLGTGSGKFVNIASDAIELLMSHPTGLPTPGYPPVDKPTISLATSLDLHTRANVDFSDSSSFMGYFNSHAIHTSNPTIYTSIGKIPCMPSQWALNNTATLNSTIGLTGNYNSEQFPFGVRISVKYRYINEINDIDVYFGLYNPPPKFSLLADLNKLPVSINPIASPGNYPLVANAFGNDTGTTGLPTPGTPASTWIKVENNANGLGVVGYINAYLDERLPLIGPSGNEFNFGGTGDLIARAVPQYILPDPYSSNINGTYGTGGTGPYGLSLEVLTPSIEYVTIQELYGDDDWSGYPYSPYSFVSSTYKGVPTTWNYSLYTPTAFFLPHLSPVEIMQFGSSGASFLGISSRMEPFSSGVLGMGHSDGEFIVGVTFGGELNI
jgi:hypothetical protein